MKTNWAGKWLGLLGAFCLALVVGPAAHGGGLIVVEGVDDGAGRAIAIAPAPPGSWPGRPGPGPGPGVWPPPRWQRYAPLVVESERFDTKVTDQVAVTKVEEVFFNPLPQRLEGTFLFPLPKGAHLDKFTMEIDGKPMQAELLGADKARGIYEDIVRRQRDPALMEYAGRDLLKVRIFPIEPNSRKRITLEYTQLLRMDSGMVELVLPLDAGKYSRQPIKSVSVKVAVASKQPIKAVYSPTHSVEVRRDGANQATAGYEASDVQPDSDFQLYFAPEKGAVGVNLLTYQPAGEEGYFLLLAAPGAGDKSEGAARRVLPKDVVFVLDTSGSMAGPKIRQAQKALEYCVESLNDGDRFEVIRFSTEVEPLFQQLAGADKENRARAVKFIRDLKATGATAIDEALKSAQEVVAHAEAGRPAVIVFLTDGMPTIGVTDEEEIVKRAQNRNPAQRRIFCFGIGTDVNTRLLDRIAEESRAATEYVLPEEDIEVKVSRFFAKIKDPVLANPVLTFPSELHVTKRYPAALPDLFQGEQLVLVGRYGGHGAVTGVLEGTAEGEKRRRELALDFPAAGVGEGHEFIARLWGTRRVGYLLEQVRLHGENAELRDEVTELARKYGIVTPYTAYLIVEDESRRGVTSSAQSLPGLGADAEARREAGRSWGRFTSQRDGDAAVFNARSQQAYGSANNAAAGIQAGAGEAQRALGGQGVTLSAAPAPAAVVPGSVTGGFGGGGGGGARDAAWMRRYGARASAPASAGPPGAALPTAEPGAADRVVDYTQHSRFAGGRNFFENHGQWVEAGVQKATGAKHVRVALGSPEYFKLLKEHPEAGPWVALGTRVQFVLGGVVYEVFDQAETEKK